MEQALSCWAALPKMEVIAVTSGVASLAGTEWFVSNCRANESNTYNRKEEGWFLWNVMVFTLETLCSNLNSQEEW